MNNQEIFDKISEKVKGHAQAKKVLINCINRSKLHYHQKHIVPIRRDKRVKTHNCLLVGGSGTGKTYLMEVLSQVLDFPLVKVDATEFTHTSASGGIKKEDLEAKIRINAKKLLTSTQDRYFSEQGTIDQTIVFVDEVDKLGIEDGSNGWNQVTQANFLTLFENGNEIGSVTYVFAGAFSGMKEDNKDNKRSMGFTANHGQIEIEKDIRQSIIEFGLMPEFVGRIHHVAQLDKFTDADLFNILENIIIPEVNHELYHFDCARLVLSESEKLSIVEKTKNSGLGVRYMRSEVSKLAIDLEFYRDTKHV